MATKHVFVNDQFSRITKQHEQSIKDALVVASEIVVRVAKEDALRSGYKIAPIVETISRTPAQRGTHSWFVYVFAADFRTRFFEKGTYRKLGSRDGGGRDSGGNRGVKPVHMLRNATRIAGPVLVEAIKNSLR